jgi:phosphatidate cytidylyltransferase
VTEATETSNTSGTTRPRGEEPIHPKPPSPAPAERTRLKGRSELALRLLTAAVLVPLVVYIIVLGGIPYLVTVVLFVVLGQREFYALIEEKGAQPLVGLGLVAGGALPAVAFVGNEYHATLLLTASLLGFMVAQLRKAQITEALASISGTFFGVFYVGWLLAHIVVLRRFFQAAQSKYPTDDLVFLGFTPESGIFFVIFTLAVVIWCDAGAYFAGRAYGRRKLAPRISPGKTVEGALGGVLAGVLAGLATKLLFDRFWPELSVAMPWSAVIPFGIALSVAGIVGDLVESLLKRDAAVKDAGAVLPGMGGILDRIDSPLIACPVAYYMLLGYLYLRIG